MYVRSVIFHFVGKLLARHRCEARYSVCSCFVLEVIMLDFDHEIDTLDGTAETTSKLDGKDDVNNDLNTKGELDSVKSQGDIANEDTKSTIPSSYENKNVFRYNAVNKDFSTTRRNSPRGKNATSQRSAPLYVSFLGGLNEIGKNITTFQCNNDIIVLDCGMSFPDAEMLGIDLVLPDFTYLEKNVEKIKALVLTHGHEDHIGAVPYFLKKINVPIYATPLTIGLVKEKLKEYKLENKAKLRVMRPGMTTRFGCMTVEFISVNHSIPDSVGVAIRTPAGTIVHTGDFKIDFTPTSGKTTDLSKFAELGREGVLALFADSTNADRPGYTASEKTLDSSFDALFRKAANKRIIIASFASNIGRIQQIISCAINYGRKVAFSGRSMINYVTIASELGYMNVPEGVIIDIDLINKYPKDKIVLMTTGSQGEPMSALSRMASAEHKKIVVGEEDFVIISAHPIPGNEKMIGAVVNDLIKRGCTVIYESMYEVHVSGHACQEELKIIQSLVKPIYFIPVHGEQKHLKRHADLAVSMGMSPRSVYIGNVGDRIEITKSHIKKYDTVPAGQILVDGLGVGDVGNVVLKDRQHLAEDGLIVVVCAIDFKNGYVISGPDIVSRGFVYVRESENLLSGAKAKATSMLYENQKNGVYEWASLKIKLRDALSKYFYERTKRSPMILPIIMKV